MSHMASVIDITFAFLDIERERTRAQWVAAYADDLVRIGMIRSHADAHPGSLFPGPVPMGEVGDRRTRCGPVAYAEYGSRKQEGSRPTASGAVSPEQSRQGTFQGT